MQLLCESICQNSTTDHSWAEIIQGLEMSQSPLMIRSILVMGLKVSMGCPYSPLLIELLNIFYPILCSSDVDGVIDSV